MKRQWAQGLILAVVLAGVIAWAWFHLGIGVSALEPGWASYARGDFETTVKVARERLKLDDQDPEAMRLLARASGRLGRDALANALYKRLGADQLDAEDLEILGLGLYRAGQKPAAERTWLDALKRQPDRAAVIEHLMYLEIEQNRFAEAIERARKLAMTAGWELSGRLHEGELAYELGDFAEAAQALEAGLARPEANQTAPERLKRVKKLLVRAYLAQGKPERARQRLEELASRSPDSETSWLLGRALLQAGQVDLTTLQAGAPYRAANPLELEPAPMVGEGRCRSCHQDISNTYQVSGHGRTLLRGKELYDFPYPNQIRDPDDPAVHHEFKKASSKVEFIASREDQVRRMVAEYAFGDPRHYVSFVGHDQAEAPYVFRLSHYREGSQAGWSRTTGHSADAKGEFDFLGKRLDLADGVLKCLFCHSTSPRSILTGEGAAAGDRAIGCERCHGPGGNHLKSAAANLEDAAIIAPQRATSADRLRLCAQCHALHQKLNLDRTDPYWLRFQSTTLPWSRCLTGSGDRFDCNTCHAPHGDADRSQARYNSICMRCHTSKAVANDAATVKASVCPVNARDDCIRCHMPAVRVEALHASFTDHYIRIHPDVPAQSRR